MLALQTDQDETCTHCVLAPHCQHSPSLSCSHDQISQPAQEQSTRLILRICQHTPFDQHGLASPWMCHRKDLWSARTKKEKGEKERHCRGAHPVRLWVEAEHKIMSAPTQMCRKDSPATTLRTCFPHLNWPLWRLTCYWDLPTTARTCLASRIAKPGHSPPSPLFASQDSLWAHSLTPRCHIELSDSHNNLKDLTRAPGTTSEPPASPDDTENILPDG